MMSNLPVEHEKHIRVVLEILRSHGLRVSLRKYQVAQAEVQFLSYFINEHGIKPSSP